MQLLERDRQKLCVVQKWGKLQLRCSKCWLIENCGPKSVLAKTGIFSPCSFRASAGRKINILYDLSTVCAHCCLCTSTVCAHWLKNCLCTLLFPPAVCFNLLLLVGLVLFGLTLNAYLQYGTVNVSSICFSRNLCLCFVIITALRTSTRFYF